MLPRWKNEISFRVFGNEYRAYRKRVDTVVQIKLTELCKRPLASCNQERSAWHFWQRHGNRVRRLRCSATAGPKRSGFAIGSSLCCAQ